MKFDLYGYEFEYSVGVENYNYIKVNCEKYVIKMINEFETVFYNRFSNMEEALKGIRNLVLSYVSDVVNWGIRFLNDNGVHKYNEERFLDEYGSKCFNLLTQLSHL